MSVTDLGIDGLEDIEQIGTGGSSRVYRARQADLDRVVAVKVLNAGEDQDVVRRFDRERKAMGRLSLHEGIVPVYSSGLTSHGEPYLVMPYYPSGSLQDQIDTGAMDWETAVHYVDTAAETIAAAHDEGIVHLDLKPANILLTVNGAPRIADFGIARLLTGSTAARTNGNAAFTPAYSAPETFLDGETGPASDVYGLGATLWALLVGHPPFLTPGNDTNLMSVIGRVVNNPVGDLRHFTPAPLCDVIERAMAKEPARRYQTAREFSQALKAASAMTDSGPVTTAMAAPLAAPVPDRTVAEVEAPGSVLFPNTDLSYEDAGMTNVLPAGPELPASLASTVAPSGPPPRPLLQETAQPLPSPVGPRPLPAQRAPYVDLERFRLGPIILGAIAFLIVGIAALLVLNGGDDQGDTTAITNPAAPSTDTAVESSLSSTTVSSTVSSSVSEAPTTASTAAAAPGTSATTSATTAATTETTVEATTSSSESSTTETTVESTTSSSESSTTETTVESTTSSTSTTVAIPIEAPTGLAATPSADEVSLIWVAPATGPTPSGYIVSRDGAAIATVTATGYTDANVVAGEVYSYTVQSVGDDAADTSDPSNPETVTVPPASTTTTPTTAPPLSVTADATARRTRIDVSISSAQCISYRVTATPEGGTALPARTGPLAEPCGTSHDVIITGLEPGTTYTIEVVGSTDAGSDSVTLTATTTGN